MVCETVSHTINFVRLLVRWKREEEACALFVQKPRKRCLCIEKIKSLQAVNCDKDKVEFNTEKLLA